VQYRYAPLNDVSVNDGPHIRRWSHEIIILLNYLPTYLLTPWCRVLLDIFFEKKKFSNIEFHRNPSSGSPVVPCGRTDRHDEGNSRFSPFLRTSLKIVKCMFWFFSRFLKSFVCIERKHSEIHEEMLTVL